MKIKKFRAGTFPEALRMVKKELGPDAVILSSEQLKGRRGGVEVVAAIDHDAGAYRRAEVTEKSIDVSVIGNELRALKETLRRMTLAGYEIRMPEEKMKIFGLLRRNAVSEEFAVTLAEKASSVEELRRLLRQELSFSSRPAGKICLVMGPTGVGKTTTIIKLATHAIRKGRRVALISLDTHRIGAVEQMKVYAGILGVPLEVVNSTSAIRPAIFRHLERDMIFIDTAGRNPRDEKYLEDMAAIYRSGIPVETHLLMSANSDASFIERASMYYRRLRVDCLGFTKVDEAERLGCILNMARLFEKPVRYVTTGQRIPQDIAFVDSGKLADMILGVNSGACRHGIQGIGEVQNES